MLSRLVRSGWRPGRSGLKPTTHPAMMSCVAIQKFVQTPALRFRTFSSESTTNYAIEQTSESVTPKGRQDTVANELQFGKWLAFAVVNPLTLGSAALYFYNFYVNTLGEADERNMKQASSFIATTRQARRESLSEFKEHIWQRPDPKEEYDENTYRRQNYTKVLKCSTYRPGREKVMRRTTTRTGLYDSEGLSDPNRSYAGGIGAHKEAMKRKQQELEEKRDAALLKYLQQQYMEENRDLKEF